MACKAWPASSEAGKQGLLRWHQAHSRRNVPLFLFGNAFAMPCLLVLSCALLRWKQPFRAASSEAGHKIQASLAQQKKT